MYIMKKLAFVLTLGVALFSCSEEDPEIIDSSMPQGDFAVSASGNFVAQNDTGSSGMVETGVDSEGTSFVHFADDFETVLATGTVTVFLSTSSEASFDPGSGNPDVMLIGNVSMNGEQYFRLNEAPAAKYTHVILWCASAGIPFGYAEIQ